jgi:hypothetical protein
MMSSSKLNHHSDNTISKASVPNFMLNDNKHNDKSDKNPNTIGSAGLVPSNIGEMDSSAKDSISNVGNNMDKDTNKTNYNIKSIQSTPSDYNTSSKPKFSAYITEIGRARNWSAESTLSAEPPPVLMLTTQEIEIMNKLDKKIFNVSTPINIEKLKHLTKHHPNKAFVSYIIQGLREGFRYNYRNQRNENILQQNLPSIMLNPEAFQVSVQKELELDRIAGPFEPANIPVTSFRINPCGLVPKRDKAEEFRVIHHHSAPKLLSVNDGIQKDDFHTTYENVGHAAKWIRAFGQGCLLAKIDIQDAYRILPVHPVDQTLQGFTCSGKVYFDKRLAFGNRASAGIFCRFADLLAWIAIDMGIPAVIHYVDDFLLIMPTTSIVVANKYLETFKAMLVFLGIPFKESKLVGPVNELVFLGISLNTKELTASIPTQKKREMLAAISELKNEKWCTVGQLCSILGWFFWACQVLPAGRPFVQSINLKLTCKKKNKNNRIIITAAIKEELCWWENTLNKWNGVHLLEEQDWSLAPLVNFHIDASLWGGGITFGNFYTVFRWDNNEEAFHNIQVLEMYVLCVAVQTFKNLWSRNRYIIFTDSQANIAAMAKGACKNVLVHKMVQWLYTQQAIHSFMIRLNYINTKENTIADLLSRGQVTNVIQQNSNLSFVAPSFPKELNFPPLAVNVFGGI